MKEILIGVLSVFAFTAIAEEAEKKTNNEAQFDGFYIGAGVGGTFVKIRATHRNTNLSGIDRVGITSNDVVMFEDQKTNRCMASVILGCGKTFAERLYLGFEGIVDFSKSRSHKLEPLRKYGSDYEYGSAIDVYDEAGSSDGKFFNCITKSGGVAWTFGPRIGYVDRDLAAMLYVRPSIAVAPISVDDYFLRNDIWSKRWGYINSGQGRKKIAYGIALGIEKRWLCPGLAIRAEVEHRFTRNLNVPARQTDFSKDPRPPKNWRRELRVRSGGYNVRVLCIYNVLSIGD